MKKGTTSKKSKSSSTELPATYPVSRHIRAKKAEVAKDSESTVKNVDDGYSGQNRCTACGYPRKDRLHGYGIPEGEAATLHEFVDPRRENAVDLVIGKSYYVEVNTSDVFIKFRDALVMMKELSDGRLETIWSGIQLVCYWNDMKVQKT